MKIKALLLSAVLLVSAVPVLSQTMPGGGGSSGGGTGTPGGATNTTQYNAGGGTFGGVGPGTTTTVLHGNAAGAPTFGAVSLTADVSGILPGANGGTANGFFAVSGPATSLKTFTFPNATATVLTTNAAVTVAQGGTGIASGTSGGVPYFNTTTSIASSALLTANALVLGGGAGAAPAPMGSLGTTTTVLHGNAAGAPTFAAVSLTADVSGILPAANGGAGTVSGIMQANGSGLVAAATLGNGLSYSSPKLSLTNCLNNQTGTSYAVAVTDAACIVTAKNVSAMGFTLVQATTTGFTSGYGTTLANINAPGGTNLTLTATTSLFGNGLTTLVLAPGQVGDIGSNGTDYPFTAVSLPVMAQDTLLGNPNAANYPAAMTLPACASDGAHALTYASHALACTAVSGASGITVGTTTITSGTTTRLLYDNAGVIGEVAGGTWDGTTFTLPNLTMSGNIDLSGAADRNILMNATSEIDVGGSPKLSFTGGSTFFSGFWAGSVTGGAGIYGGLGSTTVPTIQPNWSQAGTTGLWATAGNILVSIANSTDMVHVATTGMSMTAGVFTLKGFTVATLPASPATGSEAYVTDANAACTYGGTATGGGSTVCKMFYTGAAWKEN